MVVPAPRDDRLGGRDGDRKNYLIDASILDTYPLQALVPTIIATLVRFTSDENEVGRIARRNNKGGNADFCRKKVELLIRLFDLR